MTKFVISVILLRFILPGVLLLALALRPFGLSIFYLLLYLLVPHAAVPSNGRFAGTSASKVVLLVLVTSILLLLAHLAWHVFLLALPPYGSALGDAPCRLLETIALNLGLVSYKSIELVPAIIRLLPEVIMSVVSIVMYPVLKKLCTNPSINYVPKPESKNQQYPFVTNAGKYLSLLLIMATGVVRPSATSGVYFLCFLGCGTWWACGRELERAYAVVARAVAGVMVGHILVLFAYQCTWILDMLPNSSPYSRYFGLTQIVKMDCNNTAEFNYVDAEWATFVYPIMILVTYYILVLETRELLKPKVACPYIGTKRPYSSPNESTPLIKGIKSSTKFVNIRRDTRVLHQDSTGSVIVPDEDTEDQDESGLLDEVVLAIIGFFQVLIRSSYIATSITMMAWSIMYHSWLTFALLIWANIVWLVHNQRGFMLKTSPLLVAYAIFLLLSQYVYGMNLTEAELPATVKGINLSQIGFERPKDLPCIPLLIKSMFMIMFWVTLRQKNQEERQRRHSSALADMVAPLHLTVGTAATVLEEPEYGESILLKKFGDWLKQFCTKFWIYIVVIMLFIIGITGERMTIFRIVYMFLFLFFILLFQTSYKLWRKMLYPFWILLIVYSMINLVLVYIYQFDNFAQTVEEHLMIPQSLQYDLGLEKFVTSQLFLRLFTPTFFLIITIIQVHYFHKEFLEFSKLKSRTSSLAPVGDGTSPSRLSSIKDDISQISSEEVITVEQPHKQSFGATEGTDADGVRSSAVMQRRRSVPRRSGATSDRSLTDRTSAHTDSFRQWMRRLLDNCREKYESLVDLIFLYLEIHLIKIIFVSLMFLCVFDVCALHVPIMIAISAALLMSSRHQNWCLVIVSIMINIYLMAKMIYQIKYIQHEIFDVNCTVSSNTTINRNDAEWLGFVKATHQKSLASILKGYIGLIAIFTFQSVVTYRQQRFRENGSSSRSMYSAKTVFPDVDRQKADMDLIHCLKYLVNYGFYKFGVEITLICLIGVIGSRMDLYAVFYAFWLFVLVASGRERQACLWPLFTAFVAVMMPLQYVLAVGAVPEFCIQYPWSAPAHQNLRKWLYLPDAQNPPHATKLIFDYFLLLLCARQRRVFHLERRYGDVYPGGSNKEDIGADWETPSFVNPVPDFLCYISSWLDIIKRFVFLGMLWVTLAIMFLTGTNRVNLFSMGYLIGSFIFLWQGTDFYLRPKSAILKWWSWLLRYNVGVILVKVVLQIPGCLFIDTLQEDACWFVQLFGIGCIDKFSGGSVKKFFKMDIIDPHQCAVPREDIGLAWDGVCFAFLLLQRRLFHSYYFYRIIDESKAAAVLASRGAELIDEIRERQMQQQDEQEKQILEKIKIKMERIKANQKKLQVSLRAHHDADEADDEAEEDEETEGEGARGPLLRGDSDASARGYHTPDSPASPKGFHTPVSDESGPSSPVRPSAPLSLQGVAPPGPPSPSSALMTVSLDAYLEPQRLSFGSPPASELLPRALSPEESFPVFSPPPRRRHAAPRASIVSQTSHSVISHHTSSEPSRAVYWKFVPKTHQQAVRSGDYYMFDEFDEVEDVDMKDNDITSSDEEIPKEMGLGELLSTVIKRDMRQAVTLRRASAPTFTRSSRQPTSPASPVSEPLRSSVGLKVQQPSSRAEAVDRQEMVDIMRPRRARDGPNEQSEFLYPPEEENLFDKIKQYLQFGWAFIDSFFISVTRYIKRYSRDYRYVSKVLFNEKKLLKEKEGFGIGLRMGKDMIWEPGPEVSVRHRKLSDISVPEIRILAPSMERGLDMPTPEMSRHASPPAIAQDLLDHTERTTTVSQRHYSIYSIRSSESHHNTTLDEQDDTMFRKDKPPIVHFLFGIWYAILAHTDIVCYIMVFVNQIQSATILSIPLPLMVFLWGTLTIPRPSKTFWITLIAYTEVIVLIKSMFQFEILPWNQKLIPDNTPFTAPRIIGVERKVNYALYDLLLLLVIFFHRAMLKSLGLWTTVVKDGEQEREIGGTNFTALMEPMQGPSHEPAHYQEADKTMLLQRCDDSCPKQLEIAEISDEFDQEDNENYQIYLRMALMRYCYPVRKFYQRMLDPTARVTADVYAYMFLCDFFNFLVVIFGFAAFGTHQGDGGVQAYLEENKVPIPFLVMLILQFALIIIDRALYLRKFILGKILFQIVLIIGVHVWMFFVLPFITERTFNTLLPPPMWYMIKCIYLLLSAYQIRCGYPTRILGNFLCKGYNFFNMIFFKAFMIVPFVFELRTLMDWIWTDTSMTFMDWLKMEDIFANIFLLKCSRHTEDEFPQESGVKKKAMSKYLMGGTVLAFIIALIWFPLVLFAFGNSVGVPNLPYDVTARIRIGPFLATYQMSAQSHNIQAFTESDYDTLSNVYMKDRTAQTFLSNYLYDDVGVVNLNSDSTSVWDISPPDLKRLQEEAQSNSTLLVKFTYVISHSTNSKDNPPTIEEEREVKLKPFLEGTNKRNPERDILYRMLAGETKEWLTVKNLFPKFLKVFNKGTAKPVHQLMVKVDDDEDNSMYRNVQMKLMTLDGLKWWQVRESCTDLNYETFLHRLPKNNCEKLVLYTFNDKLFPETLNFISGSGIIGLYTTFVFLASRVLRNYFSGICFKIMFEDLPNVDRVLQMCLDIYLVREADEMALEEDLFAKLVFLYRSPETMIKWTRPREDANVNEIRGEELPGRNAN